MRDLFLLIVILPFILVLYGKLFLLSWEQKLYPYVSAFRMVFFWLSFSFGTSIALLTCIVVVLKFF